MSLRKMHDLLNQMQQQLQCSEPLNAELLVALVDLLRPNDIHAKAQIDATFELFWHAVAEHPRCFAAFVVRLFQQYQQHALYSDCGIWSLDGFWSQLLQRLGAYILPLVPDPVHARTLLAQVFHQKNDAEWLEHIDQSVWLRLWLLLQDVVLNEPLQQKPHPSRAHSAQHQAENLQQQLLKAITVLSYRISGIGLYPELLHALPELSEYESPFLAQNREILLLLNSFQPAYIEMDRAELSIAPTLVMLAQCREMVFKVRRATKKTGVSMSLTYLLKVLEQCLDRIEVLLQLLIPHRSQVASHFQLLLSDLVVGHHQAYSTQQLLRSTSELIALQVTENASKTGENYVSTDRKGFVRMYRSAAGAGAIIAIMATLKTLIARLSIAPLQQAFLYSMNYAWGFVLIHLLHFTVATKQPAMTAAALAATLQQQQGRKNPQLAELATLVINIIRTQFIAILGNISIAMPVAALVVILWQWGADAPLLSHTKALKNLHDLNPFLSLAIPHAAIAGVCLFLSGLIAGYFDNLAIYRKVGARLQAHPTLQRRLGPKRTARFAAYIQTNLGALAGNFLFGIMLGSMGTIGMILGLPLDIRHIAFASANMMQGLMCLNDAHDIGLILVSFLGVLLIGLTNLLVSFSLTIFVALRARRIRFSEWKTLANIVLIHFSTRPQDFFWPPKQLMVAPDHILNNIENRNADNATDAHNATNNVAPDAAQHDLNPVLNSTTQRLQKNIESTCKNHDTKSEKKT